MAGVRLQHGGSVWSRGPPIPPSRGGDAALSPRPRGAPSTEAHVVSRPLLPPAGGGHAYVSLSGSACGNVSITRVALQRSPGVTPLRSRSGRITV